MAGFNKVLNIFIFLLAIVALVFGILLFERRTELRERADMTGKTLASIVETLDRDSGTKYQDRIHMNAGLADPNDPTKQWTGGTLGWENFHHLKDPAGGFQQFQSILDEAKKQASDVLAQRNELGNALVSVAGTLEKELDPTQFYVVSDESYKEPIEELGDYVKQVHDREMTIIQKVEASALSINHPIEKDILKSFDEYERVLNEFTTNVENLNKRAGDYADTLSKAPAVITEYDFQMNPDRVKSETEYQNELNQLLTDFAGINEKLNELAKTKIQLEETKKQLEEYDICERKNQQGGGPLITQQGKVLKVNYEHNYVIINLGARHNLVPNVELKVARDSEFVCKVYVSRVLDDHSVCEILPTLRQGTVVEGDRVIQ
jgi:hypothetical protein